MTMQGPKFDSRISLGNIIAATVFLFSVAGAYYALQGAAAANQDDIVEIKVTLKDLQRDSATKFEVQQMQARVGRMEEYRDDTIDRLARIETMLQRLLQDDRRP